MELIDAIKCALDGDAILFLGAGFSIGGKNKNNVELPSASKLSEIICKDMEIEVTDELTIASERYIRDIHKGKGLEKLIDLLKNNLTCLSTDKIQDTVIGLNWKRIYTTNYDDIVEVSSEKQGIKRKKITATIKKYSTNNLRGAIIHINGFIRNISSEKFYEEFKITDESYLRNGFFDTKWKTQFEGDIRNTGAIVFIGYSLKYDLELQKVLYSLKVSDKCIFVDISGLNDSQKYKISTFGTLYEGGAIGLAKEIEEVSKTYVGRNALDNLQGVKKISLNDYEEITFGTKEVLNLLDKGDYQRKLLRSIKKYYVRRDDIYETVLRILNDFSICILHSNFGNGKTITLEYLASELVEKFNVYILRESDYIQDDIRIICEDKSRINILLIDDYGMHLDVFKELRGEFPHNLRIIATARTSINDNLVYELTERLGYRHDSIFNYEIEELSKKDKKELIELLNKYHLWGKYARCNYSEKYKIINVKYKNRMSNIFYMLLDSGVIEEKIKDILDVAIKNKTVKKFIIAQTINIICKFKLQFHQLVSLTNINILALKDSCKDNKIREIYDVDKEIVSFKSAILAQYIIKKGNYKNEIRDTIIEIYKNAEKQDNKKYYLLKKLIISRSNIIEIFTGNNDDKNELETRIADFYEQIMNESQVEKNPFFWLQYAITMLNLGYYPRAKLYFDNAYSYAEELESFDCFQLNTHKARFLLEYKMKVDKSKNNAYKEFSEAHKMLVNNKDNRTKLSYVLKQVGLYYEYYQEFYESFEYDERIKFIVCLEEIKDKFIEYFNSINNNGKIEYPVKVAYKEYRQIFISLELYEKLLDIDLLYNSKLKEGDRMKVKSTILHKNIQITNDNKNRKKIELKK